MARQNLLFSYFACTLTAEIRAAKAEGRYFEGVSDLSGSNITEILEPKATFLLCLPYLSHVLCYYLNTAHTVAESTDFFRFQAEVLQSIHTLHIHHAVQQATQLDVHAHA